ncbi:MAG: sugar phosphate isomerase/epimerase, partial [Clostridia bacterium]|nr:sugar phosphate isomerase/epimerase [Clostridia bacterium]
MKKGINIWSFPAGTLAESFALAKDAGFEGVEVGLLAEGEVSLKSTEKDLLAVKRSAADNGIELYSVATGLYWDNWLTSDCPKERQIAKDIVKKHLEVAKTLGCETILVVPGSVHAEFAAPGKVVDYQDAYDRSLEALSELKATAEQYRVEIGLENVWNKFLLSPMELRDFIDKIGSDYVGSYLDIGNVLANGYP